MTENKWIEAWAMFRRGLTFREIEQHFGVGHTTISTGFAKRGWYDRATKKAYGPTLTEVLDQIEKLENPKKPKAKAKFGDVTPMQLFVANFLAEQGRSANYIADVCNLPAERVAELVG